jgi:amino-acid N-acetyltransferase
MSLVPEIKSTMIQDQIALEKIHALLKKSKLPYQDVKLDGCVIVGYHGEGNVLIGSGGLEFYGQYALLRSVAVEDTHQGKSIGKYIIDDLIQRARVQGVEAIYLLTETAHAYFLKKGFRDIHRDRVPLEVKASTEFTSACPASATCMMYQLR